MPFFSIILPTFNSSKTLRECIDSILLQSNHDFEIVLMDGVSTDETLVIAKGFQDERIKIYSETDKGIYDAMNKGIQKSSGKWLYFIGSDDTLYDDRVLEDVYQTITQKDIDVLYGNVLMMRSGVINDGEFDYNKIQIAPICHQAIFYKRTVFEFFGNYNLEYKVFADSDFNLKWFFSDQFIHLYVDRIIARYAETGFSSSRIDHLYYRDLPEKLLKLGWRRLSITKIKEHATYAAQNNKSDRKYCKYLYYRLLFVYYRFLDIVKRKIHVSQ